MPPKPLKVVMAADFWSASAGAALAHGLRAEGIDVEEVELRLYAFSIPTTPTRVANRLLAPWRVRAYNDAILAAIDALKPDALLVVKGTLIKPETLKAARAQGARTLNYFPDFHFGYPGLDQATFPLYDHFFTTKSFQVETLRRIVGAERAELLHHGYNDLLHYPHYPPLAEEDYEADIGYVGNHSTEKEAWLAGIARQLPEATLAIAGNRWGSASEPALKRAVTGAPLHGDFYARAVQTSRINVAVHMGPVAPGGWYDRVSMRTFEIPACKGFMLHIDNEEVRGLFEVGTEIDVFSTPEELVEKIRYYLPRPEARREMIERAYRRTVPAYGYGARAHVIAERIAALAGR